MTLEGHLPLENNSARWTVSERLAYVGAEIA